VIPRLFEQASKNLFTRQWHLDIHDDTNRDGKNKLRTYRTFKTSFQPEPYLSMLNNHSDRKALTRLRISAHNLEIEKGRHHRPTKIPENKRICPHCSDNKIGNEMHLLLQCTAFSNPREPLLTNINTIFPSTTNFQQDNLFKFIMHCHDSELVNHISNFLVAIQKIRDPL
jgi:hypothetical protein